VIFGPLPPPESGVEGMTRLLLDQLAAGGTDPGASSIDYVHFDTKVSSDLSERERFRWRKVGVVLQQTASSARAALRSDGAYYPISQTTIGLLRDVALVCPFWLLRRRRIVHLHGGALDDVLDRQPMLLRGLVRRVFGGERAYGIVLTQSLRPCLKPLIPHERTFVVPNAVVAPKPRSRPEDGKALQVLFLSTLMERKGYRELVVAVEGLRAEGVAIELVLAGNPFREADREWLASRVRTPWFRLPGHLEGEEKWNGLQEADVLALPSVAPEGQPLAILEGMAAGCAIIATDWGGIGDTVSKSEGIVLPRLTGGALSAELHRALADLVEDRARLRALQAAARSRYEREFEPRKFIELWLSVAAAALSGKAAPQ